MEAGDGQLRVAADVTALVGMRTGVGRSVEEMLSAVAATPRPPHLLCYALGVRPRRLRERVPETTRFVPLPACALLPAWTRGDHPRIDRWLGAAQLLHATSFVTPPTELPTLVTVHDLSFVLHRETVDPVAQMFAPMLARALGRGAHVHTTTEQVATEVEELLMPGLREAGRLHVVPFGIPRLTPAGALPSATVSRLGGRPYVLALGQVGPRKDLPVLVRALPLLAEEIEDVLLVLAGPPGRGQGQLQEAVDALIPALRERVLVLGAVDEASRVGLLRGALALAYPSRYEGFGFPLLEAMSLGTPVVCSDLAVFREVVGDAALRVGVGDAAGFARALVQITADPEIRARQIAAGRERAACYTWEQTGAGLAEAYERVGSQQS